MKNSRYFTVVVIRIILIVLNCFALIWLFTQTNRPATTLFTFFLLVIQTVSLIHYHNRINRDLANFLVFLQENDTTLAFSRHRIERSFKGLVYHLDRINQKLQSARIDRERQFQYLQAVVKQVDTGIIAFDQDGKVEIFNQAAHELLGLHSLHNIETLQDICPELAASLAQGTRINAAPVKITVNGKSRMLAVKSGSIKFNDRWVQLISFQDIKPELDAGELDAWRKLIRIQRHEIINSITPITTLTTAIKRGFKKGDKRKKLQEITDEEIDNTLNCVDVIEDRSKGLIGFVERFRNLTDFTALRPENFRLMNLLNQVVVLFSREVHVAGTSLKVDLVPENLMIHADEKLLGQVIINLVKNSLEAIPDKGGEIRIIARLDTDKNCIIQVCDNGIGIEQAAMDSVFVPSYTTKENGSGIGLSISRQIIQMHNGTITIKSEPGVETVAEIVLPTSSYPEAQSQPFPR